MLDKYFSKRHSLRPESFGFVYEHVPDSARAGLYRILEGYFDIGTIGINQLYSNICHALCLSPQNTGHGKTPDLPRDARQAIEVLLLDCEWWQFFDICEVIPRSFDPGYLELSSDFYEKANVLFKQEKLDFEITVNGIVDKTATSFTDGTVKKARYLLRDAEFQEANEHFEEAVKLLGARIYPDSIECLRHVALAIESVARKINNNPDFDMIGFEEVVADMTEKGIIPVPFDNLVLYVYSVTGGRREPVPGMDRSGIGFEEAEFVLASAAAVIIYLVGKKFNVPCSVNLNSDNIFSSV